VEGGDPKPAKLKKVYTIRDVIKSNYQSLVDDEIPYKSTDKEYIGSYQRAVTTVLKNMGKKDLGDAEKTLNLWNTEGPPPDVQLK